MTINVFMIAVMNTQISVEKVDWHPADVVAALRKRGLSLRRIGLAHGYKQIQNVLVRPWWVVEQLVAQALEVPAEQIWPSRYAPGISRDHAKALTKNKAALKAATCSRASKKSRGRA
jgi:Ner family transcriptional regulator